jgi:hypothetical protein
MILGLVIAALIISAVSLTIGSLALIGMLALKNSTHKVSFIDPTTQSFSDFGEKTRQELAKNDDTLESVL